MVGLFVLQQDMKTILVWGCLLAVLIEPCMSDMYMHFPPGSNNRLNGNQDNVRNANRLFDSQVVMFNFSTISLFLIRSTLGALKLAHKRKTECV